MTKALAARLSGDERARHLHAFADTLQAHGDEILALAVTEVGTPISLATGLHVSSPIQVYRHLAELGRERRTDQLAMHQGPPPSASEVRYPRPGRGRDRAL